MIHSQFDAWQQQLEQANTLSFQGEYERARQLAMTVVRAVEESEHATTVSPDTRELHVDEVEYGRENLLSRAYHILGSCARLQSDVESAEEYYEWSLAQSQHGGDIRAQARALGNLGVVKGMRENHVEDISFTNQALELDRSIDNTQGMAMWYNNLGIAFGKLGDYTKALEYFLTAVDLDERNDDNGSSATRYNNIGIVYQHLQDHQRALDYFRRSAGIDESLGNRKGIAQRLSNMGLAYAHLGNDDLAIEYFTRALAIDDELGNTRGMAIRLSNLADVYARRGGTELSLEYLNKALEIDRALQNRRGCALRLAAIGVIMAHSATTDDERVTAERYLLEGTALSEEVGNKHHLVSCHRELADLYEQQSRLTESIAQLKLHYALEKEVLSQEAQRHAQNAEQQRVIREKEKGFEIAHAKSQATIEASNKLLHRVLPTVIADRIIQGEEEIADYFPSVSILFADIKGFTALSSNMPAPLIVRFLKDVFRGFDRIMRDHGCEKIKTIGDGYMAVAGAPTVCEDHAERIARAAIEMQSTSSLPDYVSEYLPAGTTFGIRIGVHTGSVVGGVIGDERFVYDVYSDAVNIAARMESHGEAGRIHCSEDFVRTLTTLTPNRYHFLERGEMEIKGKGLMRTYFLQNSGK